MSLTDLVTRNMSRVQIWWPGEDPDLLLQAQRLRGRKYLADQAVPSSALTSDGRFVAVDDATSWHILLVDDGRVTGCLKYADRGTGPVHIVTGAMPAEVRGSAELTRLLLSKPVRWRFFESSGWAVSSHGFDGVFLILVALALEDRLGPGLGLVTITARRQAIKLMTKLGAVLVVPIYRDDVWDCDMALMSIQGPAPLYMPLVAHTAQQLTKVF